MPGWARTMPRTYLGNQGAGFIIGIPRLGIPQVEMSDAAYGVRMSSLLERCFPICF
jgi:beta-glucosidase